jgi:hypothetical protein
MVDKTQADGLTYACGAGESGWRFVIYPNDHPPPHVHVRSARGEVKVQLPTDQAAIRVVRIERLTERDGIRAALLVEKHAPVLLAAWEKYHGFSANH